LFYKDNADLASPLLDIPGETGRIGQRRGGHLPAETRPQLRKPGQIRGEGARDIHVFARRRGDPLGSAEIHQHAGDHP
jgi:hypothetical protein